MNLIKPFSFLIILATMLFTACSNTKLPDDSLKNVPEDVSSVTAFNLNQLMAKADYDYIKSLDFFEAGMEKLQKEKPALVAIMENPFSSGVDLTKNAYLVMESDHQTIGHQQFGAMVFSISDTSLFQNMLNEVSGKEVLVRNDFKLMASDDHSLVAWNDNFGLIAMGHSGMDVEAYVQSYFEKNRKTSVADNVDLAKCLSKEYDIATWFNSNAIAKNAQLSMAASFMGISKSALENNFVHSYMNFEKGMITGTSQHFLQKELTNDLQLFFKDGIKKDLSKYIPNENLAMAFSSAFDTKGIYQIISEKTGGTTAVNATLKKYGFTSKDMANALGGDMVVAVYNNTNTKRDVTREPDIPTALLTATIGDKKLFNQFLDLGQQFDLLVADGESRYRMKDNPQKIDDTYILVQDDVFFITNEKVLLDKLDNGGYASSEKISADLYSVLADNAFGGIMNFDVLEQFAEDFPEMPFESGRMNAGLKSSSIQVDLKNKEVNSLKAFFEMVNNYYLKDKKTRNSVVPVEI